ncbi:MAG: transposase [Gammaproteobacteria bacterium]|nr:transposase [Gammaproteobacteria bacterium]
MARLPRLVVPGSPHHIIQRGNNRQPVFFAESDYTLYLRWLKDSAEKHGCSVHAYVLMTNHVHLLLTPETNDSIGKTMQTLGRQYVRYINGCYQRSGTMWEGRYKSSVVDSEQYLLTCYRYIEMNPVRAGMVVEPGEYPWSSYHANALGKLDVLLSIHPLYRALGTTEEKRHQNYRALFNREIETKTLEDIREATSSGWALGNERFREQVEAQFNRRAGPAPRGGDRKSKRYRHRQRIKLH